MQSNDLNKTEGIVLQATNYREYDKILTIFTPHNGLLKLFVKATKKTKLNLHPYSVPLAKGEFLYSEGKALCKLHEGSLLNSHHELRNSLECLETAAKMISALLKSQIGDKSSPKLYLLFSFYLENLQNSKYPETVYISFLLKLLKHEGILQRGGCTYCKEPLKFSYRYGGESFCEKHALKGSQSFSEEEEKILFFLSEGRDFSKIGSFPLDKSFISKIISLFAQATS